MKKRIVIKLSGKVFGMDNTKTLKDYATFLVKISKICQPVIVAGGGKILDELGIEVSRLNAKLLIYALKNKVYPHPPTNLQEVRHAVDSGLIVVTGGLHPGQSTNATAALIAEKIHATVFLNATDVDGIYDSDPNKNKNAKKFKRVDLKSLRRLLIHEDFVAGGYDLMDIVALKVIERSKIKTRVLKADIKKLEKAIKGIPVGTEIIIP